jgi:hypothetical protein
LRAQPGMAVPQRKERNTGLKTGHYTEPAGCRRYRDGTLEVIS